MSYTVRSRYPFSGSKSREAKRQRASCRRMLPYPQVFYTSTNPTTVPGSGLNMVLAGDSSTAAGVLVSVMADTLFRADHAQANSYIATKQYAN